MKKVYLIRHCEATGQPPESSLTKTGFNQAHKLAEFFSDIKINRIISSPFLRAIQSIEPTAEKFHKEIEIDNRLSERRLFETFPPDWLEKLEATFHDLDLKFEGGESGHEAMKRVVSVVEEIFNSDARTSIIVSHGNLLSLLLKNFNSSFGFEEWKNLSNPDVFLLCLDGAETTIERLWEDKQKTRD